MKINTLRIRRKIPEFIKKPFRWIWHQWNIKLEEDLIRYLMEYFSINRKVTMRLLKSGGLLSADLWYALNPKTTEEIKSFYQETPFYVFNLIFWHATREQRVLRSEIIGLAKGKVLDYGGAVGDMCMMAADKKLEVDYADLPGRTFNFAKWLFKKKGYNILMIDLSLDKISQKYDTIFCIDVIEHVICPKELLKDFVDHLHNNGQLMITELDPTIHEGVPFHFELGFNGEEYLKSLGMVKTDKSYLWIKRLED
ncbi:MAG: hypothetical protein A2908_01635 [Candidatus Staskawiczbacteria bacterium RIFCSPLOWO2_01_FULL_38_12b]|uniref:Methyltransferase type 11 domain-containing protein n=1 Tax=Candidatus Staskawiczbacteria bacterium RIFCSPLOWO2_01_FULL_38_12b TaxID=1802214 RepID=A0A1G2ICV2_9BACT|nr:MAG: hypothetical protein A2908_01635 [Candidatus Staskawiczbacteria bacterium RIFCSPLOWO2_01_FULL_38_12b]